MGSTSLARATYAAMTDSLSSASEAQPLSRVASTDGHSASWLSVGDLAKRELAPTSATPVDSTLDASTEEVQNLAPKTEAVATSRLIAEWHGFVASVESDHFLAELRGRHGEGVLGAHDEALIPISDVRDSDKLLLKEGAFFRLCISYEIDPRGSKRRFTEIVFRRLPAYRPSDLDDARNRGLEIARALRLE